MPELPEVETVRRALESTVRGRTIRTVRLSGHKLRDAVPATLPRRLRGRTVTALRRHGKYLLIDLDGGLTLLSHLGMSGRWLFHNPPAPELPRHVHVRIHFADGTELWFQDPRRFGLLRAVTTERVGSDPAMAGLGPDPVATPPSGPGLADEARRARINVKSFLLDQRRIAGIGNIYASEILHRAGVDPRRRAGTLTLEEWSAVARETSRVLGEAIQRFGTTFQMYRTLLNEPGAYGERLMVYDRAGDPCRTCGTPIRRIVQAQRSTYFCPSCQKRDGRSARRAPRSHTVRHRTTGRAAKRRPRPSRRRRAAVRG
jgi:formamidopyrimidine-DNA glycosylase